MAELAQLDEKTSVAGQIAPGDVADIAASGIALIVNNRPDGEAMFGQAPASKIEAEALKHGLAFIDLPFAAPMLAPEHVAKFAEILQATDGRILVYCRSGSRSTMLWAAAKVALGTPIETVIAQAAAAGYDLRQATHAIKALAGSAAV
ncbi:MAG: TIGR01244 family sulfur transferase [Rhodomicrobiaceae bacterium]